MMLTREWIDFCSRVAAVDKQAAFYLVCPGALWRAVIGKDWKESLQATLTSRLNLADMFTWARAERHGYLSAGRWAVVSSRVPRVAG